MSNQWYYNCDGRTGGPVSQVQLQLMVNSGLLLPHHQVRRTDLPNWMPARGVRGLFAVPTATPVGGVPQAQPVAVAPAPEGASPFDFGSAAEPVAEMAPAGVFDFFAQPEPPTPLPPVRAVKPSRPARKVPEPGPAPPPMPLVPSPTEEPFAFDIAPAAPPAEAPPPEFPASPVPESIEPARAEALRAPKTPPPPAAPEVSGLPVGLLPDGTILPLEGKTTLRLHRAWLLAATKFAGGASRTVYLRLQRLDGATLEPRRSTGPEGELIPVLCFHAGDVKIAVSVEGSDKPYRVFAEKVLLQSSPSHKSPTLPKE